MVTLQLLKVQFFSFPVPKGFSVVLLPLIMLAISNLAALLFTIHESLFESTAYFRHAGQKVKTMVQMSNVILEDLISSDLHVCVCVCECCI